LTSRFIYGILSNPAYWLGLIFENTPKKQNFMCVGHWDKEIAGQALPVENSSLDNREARLDRAFSSLMSPFSSFPISYRGYYGFNDQTRKKKKETRRLRDTCIYLSGNSRVISTYVF
jgi:hypothetical protein